MHHSHSYHHKKPLGFSTNHYYNFDNMKPVEVRLHPKVMKPFQGIKQVHKHHEVMHDIAPDFNSQKQTFSNGSAIPQAHALNSHRQTHTHTVKNQNLLIANVVVAAAFIAMCIVYRND